MARPATLRELTDAPNLRALYVKAVTTSFSRHGTELPNTEYRRSGVIIDRDHLAAYDRVCGFTLRDEVPATYPHMLVFPLQVRLMSDPEFPFPLPGLVHVANRITVHRPVRVTDTLDVRLHAADLRPHESGRQFDLVAEVLVGGQPVWSEVSTYLKTGGGSGRSGRRERRPAPPEPTAIWQVPGDIGRRYGHVSGDINPIHLHPLTARMFGFPKAIAHGMWTKARCLAAFDGKLPDAYTVDVRFTTPVLLPAKVGFTESAADGGWDFALHDVRKGKPHLEGTIRPE